MVDTGADNSVIPGFLAEKLYHDVDHESVRRGRSTGIGGQVDIYYHSFRICILGLDNRGTVTEDIAIKIHKREYAVVPELRVMLLGVSDFLTKYVLSINYPKKLFSVRSQH